MQKRETYIIDASGKAMGRLAVEIALVLRGKNKTDFAPYKDEGGFVIIENINKMKITGNKMKTKIYYSHTGWPGGFKETPMEKLVEKKGIGEVLKRAVYGMLPTNKLRSRQMKRLKIK